MGDKEPEKHDENKEPEQQENFGKQLEKIVPYAVGLLAANYLPIAYVAIFCVMLLWGTYMLVSFVKKQNKIHQLNIKSLRASQKTENPDEIARLRAEREGLELEKEDNGLKFRSNFAKPVIMLLVLFVLGNDNKDIAFAAMRSGVGIFWAMVWTTSDEPKEEPVSKVITVDGPKNDTQEPLVEADTLQENENVERTANASNNMDFRNWHYRIWDEIRETPFLQSYDYEKEVFFQDEDDLKQAAYDWAKTTVEEREESGQNSWVCDSRGRTGRDLTEIANELEGDSEQTRKQMSEENWKKYAPEITSLEDLITGRQEIAGKNPNAKIYFSIANHYQRYGLEYDARPEGNPQNILYAYEASVYNAGKALKYTTDDEGKAFTSTYGVLNYIRKRYNDIIQLEGISEEQKTRAREILAGLDVFFYERY